MAFGRRNSSFFGGENVVDNLRHIFEPDDPNEAKISNGACTYCWEPMQPTQELTRYCSRRCTISHTLCKLTGGRVTREDLNYAYKNTGPTYVCDPERAKVEVQNPQPSEEIIRPVPRRKRVARSASVRLMERLAELGDFDDELTIDDLIESLEDDEDIEEKSEKSTPPSSWANPELLSTPSRISAESNFSIRFPAFLKSFENLGEIHRKQTETNSVVDNEDLDVNDAEPTLPTEEMVLQELGDLSHLGMASRLRQIITRFGSLPKKKTHGETKPKLSPEITLEDRVSIVHVIPEPSGDEWKDFVHIQRFVERSGFGGKSSGEPIW